MHIWAGISYFGKTSLFTFTETLTAALYKEILETTMLPAAKKMFGNRNWLFQQDSDPKHTAKLIRKFFQKQKVKYMARDDWPPNSPDLNPIENLWSVVASGVRQRDPKS